MPKSGRIAPLPLGPGPGTPKPGRIAPLPFGPGPVDWGAIVGREPLEVTAPRACDCSGGKKPASGIDPPYTEGRSDDKDDNGSKSALDTVPYPKVASERFTRPRCVTPVFSSDAVAQRFARRMGLDSTDDTAFTLPAKNRVAPRTFSRNSVTSRFEANRCKSPTLTALSTGLLGSSKTLEGRLRQGEPSILLRAFADRSLTGQFPGLMNLYQGQPPFCPTPSITRTATARDLSPLADVCRVDLGRSRLFGCVDNCSSNAPTYARIAAQVPARYVAQSTRSAMMEDFIPEWYHAVFGSSWLVDAVESVVEPVPWGFEFTQIDEPALSITGPFTEILQFAVGTIGGFAYLFDRMPSQFRDSCACDSSTTLSAIDSGHIKVRVSDSAGMSLESSSIAVDSIGHVKVSRVGVGPGGWTWDPMQLGSPVGHAIIHINPQTVVNAAVANYYFRWATMLHSKYMFDGGDAWDYFVGLLCARAAIAEVLEIATLITHEMGHISPASLWHCRDYRRVKQNCCQFFTEEFFRAQVQAEIALPAAHLFGGGSDETAESTSDIDVSNRFDVGTETSGESGASEGVYEDAQQWGYHWSLSFGAYPFLLWSYDDGCEGGWFFVKHCSMFSYPHRVEVQWGGFRTQCMHDREVDGSVTFNASLSDDC